MSRRVTTSIGMKQVRELIRAAMLQLVARMNHREIRDSAERQEPWLIIAVLAIVWTLMYWKKCDLPLNAGKR